MFVVINTKAFIANQEQIARAKASREPVPPRRFHALMTNLQEGRYMMRDAARYGLPHEWDLSHIALGRFQPFCPDIRHLCKNDRYKPVPPERFQAMVEAAAQHRYSLEDAARYGLPADWDLTRIPIGQIATYHPALGGWMLADWVARPPSSSPFLWCML